MEVDPIHKTIVEDIAQEEDFALIYWLIENNKIIKWRIVKNLCTLGRLLEKIPNLKLGAIVRHGKIQWRNGMELPPGPKLTLMLLTARGGKATTEELEADRFDWELKYGEPTDEKINAWIKL